MELATLTTLGAIAGQYGIGQIEAHSANKAQKKAEERSAMWENWLAEQNYKRQVNFAKHAHQYEMSDLKAAGLNPVLTAMGGQGASAGGTGGGISMSPSSAKGVNLGNVTEFLKNTRENNLADYQQAMMGANTAKIVQETANLAEENPWISKREKQKIAQSQADTAKSVADAAQSYAESAKTQAETKQIYQEMPYKLSQEFGKASQELYKGFLSDKSADFLKDYGISRDEAFRLGEDGMKIIGGMLAMGASKKLVSSTIKKILTKNSAKALDFKNFPK